ncbi:HupE/UreJ family protein [Actibacterium ureilyticum]|uniref:HupE/UreJ family protein n=1 Tax=Actibacterium ureilyticum TaxID=1590614 RepID=UPI001FE66CCB|nr:HupE/UreJ family protein [Actibacterium ureilyticum]
MASLVLGSVAPVAAHEVRPAVADVEVSAETVTIHVDLAVEALVSGIDLGSVQDTNDSPLSGYYDQLRALPPEALEKALRADWARLAPGIVVQSDGARLPTRIASVRIPPVGDADLQRDSRLVIAADLPPGDAPVQVGWLAAYGPLVVRQVGEGDVYSGYLAGGELSDPLPRQGVADVGAVAEFLRYVVLGFEHILPKGLDHILFVLGLFFLSLNLRPLLVQVTAFTLAHTVTLALAALKIVTVPAQIVEPLIAASIVYVAVENIARPRLGWQRTAIIFAFGLLHGLGFASVLGEIGLNPARFVADLVGFNIGVELGQLTVIALAYLAVGHWFGQRDWYRARVAVPASAVIALVGAWWFVERVFL